jgi:hypothetical protein
MITPSIYYAPEKFNKACIAVSARLDNPTELVTVRAQQDWLNEVELRCYWSYEYIPHRHIVYYFESEQLLLMFKLRWEGMQVQPVPLHYSLP